MTTQTVIGQTTGTINVAGDVDWFKANLTAGTEYVFNIGSGTLGATGVLGIYTSGGTLVSTVASGAQIVFEPTSTGTYYVAAAGSGGSTGSYTLTESTASYDYAGTTATTGSLTVGSSVSGTLTTAGQSDWFKVTLAAGTGYVFNLASTALSAGQVAIYDTNGNLLTTGNAGDTLAGNSLFYVPTASGTYYVGASDTLSATGAFTLSAATATYDFADNINTTGTVAVGGSVTGTLTNIGQSDWFKVTLAAGSEYVFTVSGASVIPSVTLYDSTGKALISGYGSSANGGTETSYEPTASGTYYIAAGSVASTIGAFTLSVSTATPDVFGTTATTGTVSIGGTTSGTIATPGQSDWYKVTLTAGGAYALTAGKGTLTTPSVALYNAAGTEVASGSGAAFYEPTTSGTYYVAAAGVGEGTGTYSVGVTSATVDYAGTTATTGTVAVGGTTTGNLTNAGQSDWFKVTLAAGTAYSAKVTGALSGADIALYDSTGTLVAGGTSSAVTDTPTTAGTYYLGVSSGTAATGAFTVSLATYTDDYTANTSTAGNFTGTLTAAAALAKYAAGTLPADSLVVDSAADIQTSLGALEPLVAAGKISGIGLSDASTPTITVTAAQIASDAAVLQDITSSFTLSITGYSAAIATFEQGQAHFRYVPGTSHSGSDQVIEIGATAANAAAIALGSGFNAVIIDGGHSASASGSGADNYTFNVDANGTVTLLDSNTGHSQVITGANYLIFNGGAANVDGSYQSIYFVGSAIDGEVTSLYEAAFQRQPDLAGLEYYAGPISEGAYDLHQAALGFIASPEFQADYPSAALPTDKGGANDTAFITTLYNNVLHRSPSTAEVAYYDAELAAGTTDRATLLINFAESPENQSAISSFLVNTSNGAYADSADPLSASTVLGEVTAGSTLNPDAISASSIGSSVTVNGITLSSDGSIILGSTAPAAVVDLTASHDVITVENSGATIVDGTFASTITLTGATNTTLSIGHGGQDTINLLGGTNTTITNFTPGSGTTLNVANTSSAANIQILDGTSTKIAGSSLTFGAGTAYIVEIGTVTDTSAAGIAAAANKAYTVADVAGSTTANGTGEYITFLAKDAAGDTLVWFWGSTANAANGVIPTASLAAGADTNGNHLVDAAELVHVATLVGVAPSSLSAADLS